ncbi:Thermospermine synthase [Vigna angularis]|uniref:thermospermine synthase n=1 Tax=Phaseolus angularis TaxID=3914 RepID=A0A8T0JZ85_PHAAN|nr:Thermospermine synthase [Vigna angularis]
MGEAPVFFINGFSKFEHEIQQQNHVNDQNHDSSWYEEIIDEDLKWSFKLNSVLHKAISEYQDITLLDTKRFGKVNNSSSSSHKAEQKEKAILRHLKQALVLDGKMQSAETDEFIYHECLIHPSLLCHPNPKTVFIMGGGEGSAAREALKHKSMDRIVMCDIDKEVVDFCKKYLIANREAFSNKKLDLVINDAKAELVKRKERFDIIVGDLADPLEDGPCYQLYTKSFYENTLKPKLNDNGIFVTQAGPAGIFTHKESQITQDVLFKLKLEIFFFGTDVIAYTTHVPSFADTWGWVMASDQPLSICAEEMDRRIAERIDGELLYLNGAWFHSSTTMNKTVYQSLQNETHVYTEENARFIPGHGMAFRL